MASVFAADEHAVKLDRFPQAGSVVEVTSRTEQVGELGPVLARDERAGVTGPFRTVAVLTIRIAVQEVDGNGLATKAAYQILQCDATSGQGRIAGDLRGKVFQVSFADGRRMYLEPTGVPGEHYVLDRPRASILDLAVPLQFLHGESGLDRLVGTATPQKKGAAWNGDPQAIAESYAHLSAHKDRAQGGSTLKKVTGASLGIESTLQLFGLQHTLPNDYAAAEDKFEMRLSTTLPLDAAMLPLEQTMLKSTSVSGVHKGNRSVEWLRETGQARYRLLK